MNREVKPILLVLTGVAVLLLVFVALAPGSTEIQVLPSVELPPPDAVGPGGGPAAVVMSTHQDQETSFFGLSKGPTHYIVSIQFYAPSGCSNKITDDDVWPVAATDCSTGVPVAGAVTGLGDAPTGETIVVVDAEVSQDCYNVIQPGDFWPSEAPECVATQ